MRTLPWIVWSAVGLAAALAIAVGLSPAKTEAASDVRPTPALQPTNQAAQPAASPSLEKAMEDPNRKVGFIRKTLRLNGGEERVYQVWIPLTYTADKKWPVILFLHGKGEIGTDGQKMLDVGLPREIRIRDGKFECIVVIPQCAADFAVPKDATGPDGSLPKTRAGWTDPKEETVAMNALEATLNEYSCDPARVYLTGLSMGGYGTYALALKYPTKFAALVPICGGGDVGRAADLAKMSLWIWHGDADTAVSVENSRKMAGALKKAGAADFKYSELPGVGHNCWEQAYTSNNLWPWLLTRSLGATKAPAPVAKSPPTPRAPLSQPTTVAVKPAGGGGFRPENGRLMTGTLPPFKGRPLTGTLPMFQGQAPTGTLPMFQGQAPTGTLPMFQGQAPTGTLPMFNGQPMTGSGSLRIMGTP